MKGKKLLFGIILSFVFLLSTGLTYAFFTIDITGNEEAKLINVSTGTLEIHYTDGPAISLLEANPGDSRTKIFTVNNNGSLDSYYKINWQEYNNEVQKDELVVSFTCTSYSTYLGENNEGNIISDTCDNMMEEAVYNRNLKTNIKIPVGYTHVYNLTVKLLETNVNQNYNQAVTFVGEIQVEGDSPSWVESCDGDNSLRCRIVTDNIPEGSIEVPTDSSSSTYVTASNGINFAAVSSPTNGQGLYRNTQIGDGNNYYFRGGNYCAYTNYLTETITGTECVAAGGTWSTINDYKCSLDYDQTSCESKGFTYYRLNNNVSFNGFMWKIIRIDEEGNVRLLYNGTDTKARGNNATVSIAQYNNKIGDNAYVGYMQPTPIAYTELSEIYTNWSVNNATNFAMGTSYTMDSETGLFSLEGMITRGGYTSDNIGKYTCCSFYGTNCGYIARIDAVDVDGGTNRLKTATLHTGKFTTTKEQAESNEVDSPLKTAVDNWYRDNIANKTSEITSKISTISGYCNDRRVETLDGGIGNTTTMYSSRIRVRDLHLPSYKCPHESNDLFTLNEAIKGNKKLTYPVGLITADELAYGGSLYENYNFRVYAHSGRWYWLLSPSSFVDVNAESARLYGVSTLDEGAIYGSGGIRPSISLNSTATVNANVATGGDGSLEYPYVIEQ